MTQILLITPPLVQINTPYPATAFLKGFLNSKNVSNFQMDLGLELVLDIFSRNGLESLAQYLKTQSDSHHLFQSSIWNNFDEYISTIDAVISFLQNKNSTLAYSIVTRKFLPEGSRFEMFDKHAEIFGENDIQDKARHLATLYIEDLCDFIKDHVDENFGMSRYAESIARSAQDFSDIYEHIRVEDSFIMHRCWTVLRAKLIDCQPSIVAFTIPFPGNLTSALIMAKNIKLEFPNIKVIFGGGYCNTELREISDQRFFEFVDFLTLDDGERPLENIIQYINGFQDETILTRTFKLNHAGHVAYYHNGLPDYSMRDLPTPSYEDLILDNYLSVIDLVNPMHRLWSDGRWNKMIFAHGCYWAKCTFCDVSLSYIADYHHADAVKIVDDIEELIAETGQRGFHFVDEAAPPALIKEVALEIIRRHVKITWWTNIRFEKSFTKELCQLMVRSGCIAVSGGLEVASNRLLKLIQKGVTVEQVAQVCYNFKRSGILVHAYLMYGFPTQTEQETIDSLEMVRQLFELGILESAYWHKFTMTVHSPCGQTPEKFQVGIKEHDGIRNFAYNDLEHEDIHGAIHDVYTDGLNKALYNYMHKNCLDWPLSEWFDFKVKKTSIRKQYISNCLQEISVDKFQNHKQFVWLGVQPMDQHVDISEGYMSVRIYNAYTHLELEIEEEYGRFVVELLQHAHVSESQNYTVQHWRQRFVQLIPDDDFDEFMLESIYPGLNDLGLLYI